MSRRRKQKVVFFDYECTLTAESFRLTREVKNKDELVSVKAYYELNPEKDDRSDLVKKKLGILES